ncbi:hypothetical protein HF324_30960 [Chitinophaga oryzae]|uniref:Uncharacterized protein n=1 Tax=Chitinophaga oryzae TaxID=2725414 RepID=A0AAE6ZPA6_9BACT|nr:hypothetical protein [Chitinophaga oryzae]QJB35485.1 hypothetical protein HF329_30940 [Chitinophaga oryzae]QJB42028.1 hypothetical protein HF324_30960 [Chitinophaga oryzae]
MKNILIPTDFSIRSLGYVHSVVAHYPNEAVNIIFMHALHMPDSLFDLITYTRNSRHIELITADFKDGCEIIRNKYASSVNKLKVEFFHGNTRVAFRNFCLAQNIDVILQPTDNDFVCPSKRSFNPARLIASSKYPLIKTTLTGSTRKIVAKSTISALLMASE